MTRRRQTPHHRFLPFTIHTAAVQVESTSTSSVLNNTNTQEEEAPHHRPSALPLPPIAFVSTNNDDVRTTLITCRLSVSKHTKVSLSLEPFFLPFFPTLLQSSSQDDDIYGKWKHVDSHSKASREYIQNICRDSSNYIRVNVCRAW